MRTKMLCLLVLVLALAPVTLNSKNYNNYLTMMAELDRTELEVGKLQEKIDGLDASIKAQFNAVDSLNMEYNSRQEVIKAKQKILRERLRGVLFFSVPEKLGFITATQDFEDVSRGEAILSKMLKDDLEEHNRLSKDAEQVSGMKTLVEQEKVKLEENRKLQSSVLDDLKKKLEKKRALIKKAKMHVGSYQAFVTRMEKGSKKIEKIALQGAKNQINAGVYLEGSSVLPDLIAPLKGKITNGFGKLWDQKIRDWIYNRGVTVEAEYGSKVSAVYDGVISFAGWIPAYGRVLVVTHPDGLFSVYGHLSRLFFDNGDKVTKGSVVAQTGDSGSTEKPSLYFELRNATNNIDPTPLFY